MPYFPQPPTEVLDSIDGKDFATEATQVTLATETKLEAVRVLLASIDANDFATETTQATLATEATLASLEAKDFATETTLAALAAEDFSTETTLASVLSELQSIDAKDFATETTLASIDAKDFATEVTLATLGTEVTLASLEAKDFATETTLAALAAEDFSTETTLEAARVLLENIDDNLSTGDALFGLLGDARGLTPATQATVAVVDSNVAALHVIPLVNPDAIDSIVTAVTASTTVVTLSATNTSRQGWMVTNSSNKDMYLKLGAGASPTSFTAIVPTDGFFELPSPVYTGIITAIWDNGSSGDGHVTELELA